MKILKLRFKNLNSLKGENEINFTVPPLSETGIFAITGPTGAGKSTILDAITLALYNQTPRSGINSKKSLEKNGAIITRHTFESYSEIDYEANGKQYRSKWSVHIAKKSGTVQDYHMELSELPENVIFDLKKSEVPTKNEQIIGLSYEQFVKSILLSQGDFAKFLKANANERGELLEKITGTEIYRLLGQKAFEKQKIAKTAKDTQQAVVNTYQVLTDEEERTLSEKHLFLEHENKEKEILLNYLIKTQNIKQQKQLLQQEISELNKIINTLKIQQEKYRPFIQKLDIHEKLIILKSEIFSITEEEKRKVQATKMVSDFELQLKTLETNKLQLVESLAVLKKKLENEKNILETTLPKIVETKKLDNSIVIEKRSVSEHKKILEQTTKNIETLGEEIINLKNNISQNIVENDKLNKWLNEHQILADLVAENKLIDNKLSIYLSETKKTEKMIKDANEKNGFSLRFSQNTSELKNVVYSLINSTKASIENILPLLQYQPHEKEKLENDITKLRDKYKEIENLITITKRFQLLTKQKEENEQWGIQKNNEIQLIDKELSSVEIELEISQKIIEELRIKLERQQLESKYKDDRLRLQENEPCYLCGSKTHPYVSHYEDVLDVTKNNLKETEKKFQQWQKFQKEKVAAKAKTAAELISLQKNIKVTENELLEAQSLFQTLSEAQNLKLSIYNISEIENTKQFVMNEGLEKKKQKQLFSDREISENKLLQLETIDIQLKQTEEAFLGLNFFWKKYHKYLENSKNDSERQTTLQRFENKHKTTIEAANKISAVLVGNQKVLEEKQLQAEKQNIDFVKIKEEHQKLSEILENILAERKKLFGTENPEKVEKQLSENIQNVEKEIVSSENSLTRTVTTLEAVFKQLEDKKAECSAIAETIENNKINLLPKLKLIGFETVEDAIKGFLTEKEVNEIKTNHKKLETQLITTNQTIHDKETEILKLKEEDNNETDIVEIQNNISFTKNLIQENNRNIGFIKNKIIENNKQKDGLHSANELFVKLETEFNKWKKLNDLIGDSEGKRFSKFAQELTLIQLISIANKHLKNLSERYLIQKNTESDDLLIIDCYQANAERSVKTLSGGESFLVSLSLALGLSDLAGRNTKIDSLFIDEGFGTLDIDTLNIALETLEKLQIETNRTIGIISHVPALKERITTQIELSKNNSGYSNIIIGVH